MGFVHVNVWVANPAEPERRIQVEFLADSGSLLSRLPASTLENLWGAGG